MLLSILRDQAGRSSLTARAGSAGSAAARQSALTRGPGWSQARSTGWPWNQQHFSSSIGGGGAATNSNQAAHEAGPGSVPGGPPGEDAQPAHPPLSQDVHYAGPLAPTHKLLKVRAPDDGYRYDCMSHESWEVGSWPTHCLVLARPVMSRSHLLDSHGYLV